MSTVTSGGGIYASSLGAVNKLGGQLSIPELLVAIQMERGQILDNQIRDQMADMQKRNEWLSEANKALAGLRAKAENGGSWPSEASSFASRNGIQMPSGTSKEHYQQAIQNFKSAIDTVNNQSQMDMVRLQGLMDKRNQAFDLMSNTISKTGKSLDSIIGNMR